VIELVKSRPDITITELATAMGMNQNYLYTVLPPLAKDNRAVKRGKGWHAGEI
jgi:DNA-binding IscR family transcriptional regulator